MCGGPLGEASFRFIGDFVSTSLTQFEQSLVDEFCINTWEVPTPDKHCLTKLFFGISDRFAVRVYALRMVSAGTPALITLPGTRSACRPRFRSKQSGARTRRLGYRALAIQ